MNFRLFNLLTILLLIQLSVLAQENWVNHTNKENINVILFEGNAIWIGSEGGVKKIDFEGNILEEYTMSNGLPYNNVTSLAIDHKGNKWFGTKDGKIAKFDGTNWVLLHGIPDRYDLYDPIFSIREDKMGNMWFGLESHVIKFDGLKWTDYFSSTQGLVNGAYYTIEIDLEGKLWVCSTQGLSKFDGSNWTSFNHTYSQGSFYSNETKANSFKIDGKGNIWIATNAKGILKFDGKNWTKFDKSNSELINDKVNALLFDKEGILWAGTKTGILKFDGKNWTLINNSSNTSFSSILMDEKGNIFCGNENGIYKHDCSSLIKLKTPNSNLGSNLISSILTDRKGNIWVGTSNGLSKFDGKKWTNIQNANPIYSITMNQKGDVWTASENMISKFEGKTWYDIIKTNCFVTSIKIDNAQNYWLGGSKGLMKIQDTTKTIFNTSNSGIPSNSVHAIAIDKKGNKWVGTENGLAKFDNVNWETYITWNSVNSIEIDKHGNKWVGTSKGIAKFNDTVWTYYQPNLIVKSLKIDQNESLWVGTDNGVFKFDGYNWTKYLEGISVNEIAIDKANSKWFATFGEGVFKFKENPQTLKATQKKWEYFTDKNEILNIQCIDDTVWTFTTGGIVKRDPKGNIVGEFFNDSCFYYSKTDSQDGDKWLCTDQGIKWFHNGKWEDYYKHDILGSAYSIEVDKNGHKWVNAQGVTYKFDGKKWSSMPQYKFLKIDTKGNVWLRSSKGLTKFDGNNYILFDMVNSTLRDDLVLSLAEDPEGRIWAGTELGAAMYDGQIWTTYKKNDTTLRINSITTIAIDRNGNKWFGSKHYTDIMKFDGVNWTFYEDVAKLGVTALSIDNNNNLWVGTKKSLIRFDGTNWKEFDYKKYGLISKYSSSISDTRGNVWFARIQLENNISKFVVFGQ
jgi:ligand-binding sensor domain-containing protein